MTRQDDRRAEHERFRRIDQAFKAGDLAGLRVAVEDAVEDASAFPNNPMPLGIGPILTYAIYWSPLRLIEELLALGADPNGHDNDGFPPLIAALCKTRSRPGSLARHDVVDVMARLLAADPSLRTRIDDYETALEIARAAAAARPDEKRELAAIIALLDTAWSR